MTRTQIHGAMRASARSLWGKAALATMCAAALAGCNGTGAEPAGEPPLAGATIGGPFELTSETGETVRWSDFEGQYRIVYFGYAYCPDICPTDVQRTMQGLTQFQKTDPWAGENIQPLFVTIDPERDTQEVVAEFTDNFHPELIGLTGTPEQVKQAADNFRIFYAKGEESEGGGYLMDHSNVAYLFGPSGEPIATLPHDLGADAVEEELMKWVR